MKNRCGFDDKAFVFDNTKMPPPETFAKRKGLLVKALGRMGTFGTDGKPLGVNGSRQKNNGGWKLRFQSSIKPSISSWFPEIISHTGHGFRSASKEKCI